MQTFKEIGLNSEIQEAVKDLGFENPTPIQAKAIPFVLDSARDLVAFAQTGTGKTAAFSLPIIHQIDADWNQIQALILCPTRELCLQISRDIESFTKYLKVKTVSVYGGASMDQQVQQLRKGAQIVVGTPGRVLDLIKRKKLKVGNIQWLVLDEADEMLSMGFKDDLDTILAETPEDKQTLLFSATMPPEMVAIAEKYMDNPEEISAGKRNKSAENVEHSYYLVSAKDKYLALKRIADMNPSIYGIVFCRTRRDAKEIADRLINDHYNADALHGDLSQAQRDHVMNRFRQKHLQILVATDVAARGLDVNDLTHVINFNLPDDNEVYIHRSGRTGRAGKSGKSISIVHSRETRRMKDIERKLGKSIDKKEVPTGKDICEKQLFNLIDKVENVEVSEGAIDEYLPQIYKKLEWLSREDLIKRFVSVEFNRFLSYYKNAPDLNIRKSDKTKRERPEGRKGRAGNYSRFFINVGEKNRLSAARLIGLINEQTDRSDISIGKIEILRSFSFFEVDKDFEKEILNSFGGAVFEGVDVNVEVSNEKPKYKSKSEGRRDKFYGDKSSSGRGNRKKRNKSMKYRD